MCTDRPEAQPARPRRSPAAGPLVVGLVGPAGSGKSTIARALAADGALVLDADRLAHELGSSDSEVRAALVAEYGPDVYMSDGVLDRKRVGERVFADAEALRRLNLLMHPRIVAKLRDGIAHATREGFTGVLVVDAALMLDWNFERECDAVLAVIAPRELQLARLMAARGWTEGQAELRLANTRSNAAFAEAAEEVVMNDRSEAAAVAAARAALERMLAARERRSA